MKKKIFYWFTCLKTVVKVISSINSTISALKYSQEFEASILNTCGVREKSRSEFMRENIEYLFEEFGKLYFKNITSLFIILSKGKEKIKYRKKIQTKKKSLNFTIFRHYKILNKVLSQK